MNEHGRIRVWILLALAVAAAALYLYSERAGREGAGEVSRPLDLPPEDETPAPEHPVPEIDASLSGPVPDGDPDGTPVPTPLPRLRPPLPPLDDSDVALREALAGVIDADLLERWLRPERIIERTVVTVHSLDAAPVPLRFRPVEPVPGLPAIRTTDAGPEWDPSNAQRYAPLVEGLRSIDPAGLARVYIRFYPLFQEAYAGTVDPEGYFNDRVVAIIDHLLAAPSSPATFALERPEVLYRFVDPALEGDSWGRKILYRLSPEQDRAVRRWLAELRTGIAARPPEAGPLER